MGKIADLMRTAVSAPFRALLPKNPWLRVLVYALPVVLLLALFGPALEVVLKLLDFALRVIEPLLHTTIGRVLLLLVVLAFAGTLAVWLLRSRVRDMRAEAALGRHLQATAALVGAEAGRSRELFQRIARYRGPLPERYPHLVADANLKLARGNLEAGAVDEALGHLARVIEPGLPDELLRSLLQLRVRAWRRQGDVLPGALRREADAAVERFPHDYHLLVELREMIAAEGDPEALAAIAERVCKHAPPAATARERQQWLDALVAAGAAAVGRADRDSCKRIGKKLQQADKDGPSAGLLSGDMHRAAGEFRQAIRAYGATRSPVGLDRIAELLTERPGVVEPRELLECCPMHGTLLLVARELARQGDTARAERAARRAAEELGPTATVCAVLAEVLQLLGQDSKARLLREQAIVRLVAMPPDAPGAAN